MDHPDEDTAIPDASPLNEEEDLDEKYPNRPRNHSPTLPFHDLFTNLFNPLNDNKKKPVGQIAAARRKVGPHGPNSLNPQERRRDIIQRFISRWRKEVGDDIYPAFRLIVPDKDRDRAMYGLKEKVIGKLLVRIMKIDKNSEDGFNLLNWKLPGQSVASRMAGDFAGRCYEVLSKRPMRTDVGNMTIEEVNERLDQLSSASKEDQQLPILAEFYRRMNPEELMWLIRIILRQMKVGATERTLFGVWHPDAERLFSISSSLRRVCWELHDPNIRLEGDDRGVSLMQCFQPQLAQFQMHSFEKMVQRMQPTEEDPTFWIEEKLDGERLQLHMETDDSVEGGKRFSFWSRKAKDYTYLYGNGFYDPNGSLTRHLKDAFVDGVDNIILDGEMITWDPEQDAPVPFGTLKTAALSEQRDPNAKKPRPLLRVFDILYLNDRELTRYTLRDRRKAIEKAIRPVHRRFEIHPYTEATTAADIEPILRKVVEEASEGLVLKNPRSPYRLNERHDDWMKVKPEYMTEFGESLDLVVIGGYYGGGRRGGILSSYLCGLHVDDPSGSNGMKYYSFCKVGGGFTAADYANIRHHTDGKWKPWNPKKPPSEFIELAGGEAAQRERPDEWIRPDESVVVCVKAASVSVSEEFRMGLTLRFPRFKKLRMDKDWKSSLSVQEFLDLKSNVEKEQKDKEFTIDNSRRKRIKRATKKPLSIAGYDAWAKVELTGPVGNIFNGLNFFVMSDTNVPQKKSKAQLEQLVKSNGGKIYQTNTAAPNTICIADRRTVKVASLQKSARDNIVRPIWLFDCIKQNEFDKNLPQYLLPLEPRHMFFTKEDRQDEIAGNVDEYKDSYTRDVTPEELRTILDGVKLKDKTIEDTDVAQLSESLFEEAQELGSSTGETETYPPGWLFKGLTIHFHSPSSPTTSKTQEGSTRRLWLAQKLTEFGGADIAESLDVDTPSSKSKGRHSNKATKQSAPTHIVIDVNDNNGVPRPNISEEISSIRKAFSEMKIPAGSGGSHGLKIPHLVTVEWIEQSWKKKTLLDEERFAPRSYK